MKARQNRRAQRAPSHFTGPVGGLMDPRFTYTPSHSTDIRETFRRLAREARAQHDSRQGRLL